MTETSAADREEVRDLCARYALALDTQDWTALRSVFADDAVMTFAHVGDVHGVGAIADTCREALEKLDASQHLVGTVLPVVDGDTARCTSYFQAQHVRAGDQLLVAGRYEDHVSRGQEGWRITHRTQSVTWSAGDERVVF